MEYKNLGDLRLDQGDDVLGEGHVLLGQDGQHVDVRLAVERQVLQRRLVIAARVLPGLAATSAALRGRHASPTGARTRTRPTDREPPPRDPLPPPPPSDAAPPAAAAGLLYRILRAAAPAGCSAAVRAAAPSAAADSVSTLTKWRRRLRFANLFLQPLRHVKLFSGKGPAAWKPPFVRWLRPDWLASPLLSSRLAGSPRRRPLIG